MSNGKAILRCGKASEIEALGGLPNFSTKL